MTTPIEQPELGGVAEIAEELGVPKTTVSMWDDQDRRRTNGYPQPLARLRTGPVFDMNEVRTWYRSRYAEKETSA